MRLGSRLAWSAEGAGVVRYRRRIGFGVDPVERLEDVAPPGVQVPVSTLRSKGGAGAVHRHGADSATCLPARRLVPILLREKFGQCEPLIGSAWTFGQCSHLVDDRTVNPRPTCPCPPTQARRLSAAPWQPPSAWLHSPTCDYPTRGSIEAPSGQWSCLCARASGHH